MFARMKEDIKAFMDRDPAAKSPIEIFLLYPGLKAIRMHRRAHKHYLKGHSFRAYKQYFFHIIASMDQ